MRNPRRAEVNMGIEFSLVVPTFNEVDNVDGLVERVHSALAPHGIAYELIIVDDNSPDGTAERAMKWSEEYPVRVIKRIDKSGLASAVMDGWKEAQGRVLGVTDADGSHDASILPQLFKAVHSRMVPLAVGSRYIPGGGIGNWPWHRQLVSKVAVYMASPICPVADLTSGYFVLDRDVIDGVSLNPVGFKIGFEVMMLGRYEKFVEIPYTFQDRALGSSKLGMKHITAYLGQLVRLLLNWLPRRPRRIRVQWDEIEKELATRQEVSLNGGLKERPRFPTLPN